MEPKQYPLYQLEPALRISALCSAFQATRPIGYSNAGELHDFWEAVFILSGEVEATAGDSIYILRAGQMILHPPLEFHRMINTGKTEAEIVILSFTAATMPVKERLICTFQTPTPIVTYIKDLREQFIVERDFLLRSTHENSDKATIQRIINYIECYLLSLFVGNTSAKSATSRQATQYSAAVAIMQEHLHRALNAPALAALCNASVSSLQKLFLKYTGMGMMQYFRALRMQRARLLLSNGTSVKETAATMGFDDQNYFSTAYKRHFGIPPSQALPK